MQVETYEQISSDPSQGDNALVDELTSPEAVELITQLGLTGQQSLLHSKGDDEPVTRSPYRLMSMQEMRVYKELFPQQTKLADYAAGPIPLRVMQIAARAGASCGDLYVWHPQAGQDDPVLVGKVKSPAGYGFAYYLLARWGESLAPFEELVAKAVEHWKSTTLTTAEQAIRDAKRQIEDVDILAKAHFRAPGLGFGY